MGVGIHLQVGNAKSLYCYKLLVMLVYIKSHYGDLRKLIQIHIFLLREMVTFSRNRLSCNHRPLRIPLFQ